MRKLLAILYFCCLSIACLAQTLGFTLQGGKRKVEIPIEILNNLVVVPVILNETLPLKFVVDTGVRTAILTQKSFSDILNLTYSRKYSITGAGGEKVVDAYVTNNVSLRMPGVLGTGHALLVLDKDYLELRNYLGTDVHGILGYELFSRFIVQIDYERKVMTLMLPSSFRKKKQFETLPITIEDTKPYVVLPVVLKDGTTIDAKLLMDSGASHALLLDPTSDARIKIPERTVSSYIGRGLGGEIKGKAGRINSIQLGKYVVNDVITNFPDVNSYTDSLMDGLVFRHGTIGGELMSRFTVIFNFSTSEVYLRKNASYSKAFHYNLSGITIKANGQRLNEYVVTEVRQHSVAETAGVKPGDQILSLNGVKSASMMLNHVINHLSQKPGKRIRLELLREGNVIKTEFVLTDPI